MGTKLNFRSSLNRRSFLQGSAAVGAGALGLEFLASCGTTTSSADSTVTATIDTLPAAANKGAVYVFNQGVKQFEQTHAGEKIVGRNNPYDPTTYFARLAAGQLEDVKESWFTEPPLLISKHAVADITSLAKGWQYWSSYNSGIASIATDPATGKIYGIPVNGYALGIYYNRKMFKAAGLDPDKPPTTWEEFRGYAKQLKSSSVAGYAETSTSNQGGWHFTNWMYTAGGDMQSADGKKATFNSDKGVSVLQMLKDMRFTDQSLTKQQLFTQADTLQLLATNKVAMVVMAPDQLNTLKSQYQANLDDFGIGPMPQNGGNAALTGGNIFIFNPKSSKEKIKVGFDYVIYNNFDLNVMESNLASQSASGQVVGGPTNVLFTGEFQQKVNELTTKYANTPLQNYQTFNKSTAALRPEPRKETQKMYAALDPVVQAVLTNASADPKKLLDQAAQQFQQVLDQSAS
ncbi:substrate-binding domain-containing protein [Ktedonobacter racemifer]|uniref:Extracellular solute-binding protein family 1 n=1 Tax=Ktedonobacter racemifer DSM 44963 TaxID=485913 RepID=D6U7Q9_KTERA|nr:substrate-binding domain-containing protein [Ktedonobacter racemifer]EFH79920.1 extracellular solute-binding protein family 1 [Ktedonobacter racemifer DSM 44963]